MVPPATDVERGLIRPAPRWVLPPPPDPAAVRALEHTLRLPPSLCALLVARGHGEPERARRYLRPLVEHLHDPAALPDAERATARIRAACAGGERILVHGDYDVDGISGTALLSTFLRGMGADVVPFVPHRLRHGYDFGPAGVAAAEEAGCGLIVTVDCGIRAHAAVDAARAAGIDVIVTDHHTPAPTLPAALAVVNPNRADSSYPNPGLAGAAVAFKLCELLARQIGMPRDDLLPHLDLVALASIADLVPLTDENRALTRIGLRALERTERTGLRALLEATGLAGGTLEAGAVGFVLAPPINAAGRIADARQALDLLLESDPARAATRAGELVRLNQQRQEEDRRTLAEALADLGRQWEGGGRHGLVVVGEGWHPGVIGIVASRLVERVHRPVVVVSLDGDRGRGSARSVPGFHLYEAIEGCGHLLERFGGHRMAAGLDVGRVQLEAFREAFDRIARERLTEELLQPALSPDLELDLAHIDDAFYDLLRHAGPFGVGNPRPLFLARNVPLTSPPRSVGKGHLALELGAGRARFGAVGFGLADRIPPDVLGTGPVDVVFQIRRETWRGRTSLRLRVSDIRRAQP
ncbi:MAG: single-stranded-DNA-specific exonuclease RecJ [Gemmatimonadota bacterium]|nr:single-stranded-DNA-specific exonuclease RecJ [Gemmatimonadota bacterium]